MAGHAFTLRENIAVLAVREAVIKNSADKVVDDLKRFADAAGAPFLDVSALFDPGPFLLGQTLDEGIATLRKRALVLGGGALEGAITQTAIQTLLDGYDVFVPADLCIGMDDDLRPIHFDRLRDVGGTVTSHRQIVLELLAQTSDPGLRAPLETHVAGL